MDMRHASDGVAVVTDIHADACGRGLTITVVYHRWYTDSDLISIYIDLVLIAMWSTPVDFAVFTSTQLNKLTLKRRPHAPRKV